MTDKQDIIRSFRQARIAGEKRLQNTKNDAEFCTEWEKYSFVMLGFEAKLQSLGVSL